MAQANNGDETMISGINVTPLVDVVLVLLVVMMVTATYIASKTIPVDLPKGATGRADGSGARLQHRQGGRRLPRRFQSQRGRAPEQHSQGTRGGSRCAR